MKKHDNAVNQMVFEGMQHLQSGNFDEAETRLLDALKINPTHIDALHLLGLVNYEKGNVDEAIDLIRKAISSNGKVYHFYKNLGLALQSKGRFKEAEENLRKAITLAPRDEDLHFVLGTILSGQGRLIDAVKSYRTALGINPKYAVAHFNLGEVHLRLREYKLAIERFQEAIALQPDFVEAHNNLGKALDDLGLLEEALSSYRKALEINPNYVDAYGNLGLVYKRMGRLSDALKYQCVELAQKLDDATCHTNLGHLLLQLGDLQSGWEELEYRWKGEKGAKLLRGFAQPWWEGESLEGKTILVWADQGIGDEMRYVSYMLDMAKLAGHCILECEPRLVSLFSRSFPKIEVIPRSTPPHPRTAGQDIAIQRPLSGLARWLRPDVASFPKQASYFVVDKARVAFWKKRLASLGNGLKVGIGWRSSVTTVGRVKSYTSLEQWGPIFGVAGVEFVNLQYGDCEEELAEAEKCFGIRIHRWRDLDLKDDLDEVAALTVGLDLVITAPTAVGEMAGALGVPVWVMHLRYESPLDFGLDYVPWHPSMKMHYREWNEGWEGVIDGIARELTDMQGKRHGTGVVVSKVKEDVEALMLEGVRCHQAGDLAKAEDYYRRVLAVQPDHVDGLHLLGVLAHQQGNDVSAVELINKAICHNKKIPELYSNLGTALHALGDFRDAEANYRQAITLSPDFADAHYNLGRVLEDLGRFEEALSSYRRVIKLNPEYYLALQNTGKVLFDLERLDEAEVFLRRAILLQPDNPEAHYNLGNVLRATYRLDDAIVSYRQAIALNPDYGKAHSNLGIAYMHQGRLAEARESYMHALALLQDSDEVHRNLAVILLHFGELKRGWEEYEYRWTGTSASSRRNFPQPWWRGEPLEDKTILVWGEQGVGDEMRFASFMLDLQRLAKHCVLECDPRLVTLLSRSFPKVEVVGRSEPPHSRTNAEDIAVQSPMSGLARQLRPDLASFPMQASYFVADGERVAYWRQRLEGLGGGPKIGIGWRSGLLTEERGKSYTSLQQWGPIFGVADVQFVNLQYGDCEEELAEAEKHFGIKIHRWNDLNLKDDLDEVAALTAALDLVITAPTAVGEMAGALGVPVWVMHLKYVSPLDFGEDHVPWHPSMKMFYREWNQGWDVAIEAVSRELQAWGSRGFGPLTLSAGVREDIGALMNEGIRLHQAGELVQADECYRRILAVQPNHADALHLRGLVAHQREDHDGAIALITRAIELKRGVSWFYGNLGSVFKAKNLLVEAEEMYRKAITLDPHYAEGYYNLANVLKTRGLAVEAEQHYRMALELNPNYEEGHTNLSHVLLQQGKLKAGWEELEYRWKGERGALLLRGFAQSWWAGESLKGKTILVWGDQGVGDEMRYASYMLDMAKLAGHCILECEPRLVSLFSRSFPKIEVIPRSTPPHPRTAGQDITAQRPLSGLARWLRPDLASFPKQASYFVVDKARVAFWKQRLASLGNGLKVGIGWRSSITNEGRGQSYTSLEQWGPIFGVAGVEFVNLQYGDCEDELAEAEKRFGITIHRWNDLNLKDDLDEVAALTAGLDLVITAPTAVGEMAGALGVTVWIMHLRYESPLDFGLDYVPWHPSMKMHYREWNEGWEGVIDGISRELTDMQGERHGTGVVVRKVKEDVDALMQEGVRCHQAGDLAKADDFYRRVLAAQPDHGAALHMSGLIAHQQGNNTVAVELIKKAIRRNKKFPEAYNNLGVVLQALGLFQEAEESYRKAISLLPRYVDAHYNLGRVLEDQERWEEAASSYRQVLKLNPNSYLAHNNLGKVLNDLERFDEAEKTLRKAIALQPDCSQAHYNLGITLRARYQLTDAVACYQQAIALDPNYGKAYSNMGVAYMHQGQLEKAHECFVRALAIVPDFIEAHGNLASLLLQLGDLKRGWEEMDYRWTGGKGTPPKRGLPQAWWQGESLEGKTILVWGEQGVGDEMRFVSYMLDMVRLAQHCILECDARLVPLFSRSFPEVEVIGRSNPPNPRLFEADIAVQCPMLSLARWLRTDLASFPTQASYFVADKERVAFWRQRLATLGGGLKVGIGWRSGMMTNERMKSYTTLEQWGPIFGQSGVTFINLQYGDCEEELAAAEQRFGITIHRWADLNLKDDFDEVAALTQALDLVITAPTAVGEMAGALGVPVWVMHLHYVSPLDLGTDYVPWHPSMKMFYREWDQEWDVVIDGVARELESAKVEGFKLRKLPEMGNLDVTALMQEGMGHHQAGRLVEAEACYRKILAVQPDHADALHLSGLVAHQEGNHDRAIELISQAIQLKSNVPWFYGNLGSALKAKNLLVEAEEMYRVAVALDSSYAEGYYNLANVLKEQGKEDEAQQNYRQALAVNPNYVDAWINFGNLLFHRKLLEDSLVCFEKAIAICPNHALAHFDYGNVLKRIHRLEDALVHYDRALDIQPDYQEAHQSRVVTLLHLGDLPHGWEEMDYRWTGGKGAPPKRGLPQPWWQGESLEGKTILVWGEQGVGDEMRFTSFMLDMVRLARHCILECDARLVTLLSRSFPEVEVIGRSNPPNPRLFGADIAVQCPILGLARWLRPDLASFPTQASYFVADKERVAFWRRRLAALGGGLMVGIGWRSGNMTDERVKSYTTLEQWGPIFGQSGVTFVNLQYGDCERELAAAEQHFGITIHRWADLNLMDDFDEVAALTKALDLVITAPTAVGEMAGALGVPVWVMHLRYESPLDLGTNYVPWHPSMKMFYRDWDQEWDVVIDGVARELERAKVEGFKFSTLSMPMNADVGDLMQEGVDHHQTGELTEAEACYRRILALQPDNADALHLSGLIAHQEGNHDRAIALISQAIQLKSNVPWFYGNFASALKAKNLLPEAAEMYRVAVALDGGYADGYYNLANVLNEQGEVEDAEKNYRQALALNPDYDDAWINLGKLLFHRKLLDESLACFEKAIAIRPDNASAHFDYGHALERAHRLKDALREYERAIELKPDYQEAHTYRIVALLQLGELKQGWDALEYRWTGGMGASPQRGFPQPWWQGESLEGKTILVWGEQGVADEMRFASFMLDMVRRAQHCILECDARLVALLSRSFPGVEVIGRSNPPNPRLFEPDIAVQSPLVSLARWLRPDLASFPAQPSYLAADEGRVAVWRQRLGELGEGPKIGISWRSGMMTDARAKSYTSLEQWGPIFGQRGVTFVNLQYGDCEEELAEAEQHFGITIHRWADLNLKDDFDEVAALTAALALVITAPTAVAEMAGALGVPVWVMHLRYESPLDLGTDYVPWHPSMKMFYRDWDQEWIEVIENVAACIGELCK